MKKVTLQFPSLSVLSEFMYQFGVDRPEIDYSNNRLVAELSEDQVNEAVKFGAQLVSGVSERE